MQCVGDVSVQETDAGGKDGTNINAVFLLPFPSLLLFVALIHDELPGASRVRQRALGGEIDKILSGMIDRQRGECRIRDIGVNAFHGHADVLKPTE